MNASPDVTQIRAHFLFVLEPATASAILVAAPDVLFSLQGFHSWFIAPALGSANANVMNVIEPLLAWWRVACTDTTNDAPVCCVTSVEPNGPVPQQELRAWVFRVTTCETPGLEVGGPGLTNVLCDRNQRPE